jgi:hypothetical protein
MKEMHWTEHLSKAVEGFFDDLKGKVPEEFKTHAKASIKEMLLAMKSILDKGIEALEEKEERKRVKKVKVE